MLIPPRQATLSAAVRPVVTALLVLATVGLLALAATPATAQGNSGTIKVHDDAAASPPTRNEPHVTGEFWIEGMNMAADEGALQLFAAPPTGDGALVLDTTWSADDGTPEHHFLAGPFTLPCGHYRVEAQNGLEEDDFPGGAKSKMFWVEGCEPQEEPEEIACPTDLAATANGDETITLTWTPVAGSDGTNVYRADGAGDFAYVTTVGPGVGTWTDDATTAGDGYAYTVTTLDGNEESTGCPLVEVTAIPVFPTLMALGAATGLGALAYLGFGRRKA